jgi:hypothetical protein
VSSAWWAAHSWPRADSGDGEECDARERGNADEVAESKEGYPASERYDAEEVLLPARSVPSEFNGLTDLHLRAVGHQQQERDGALSQTGRSPRGGDTYLRGGREVTCGLGLIQGPRPSAHAIGLPLLQPNLVLRLSSHDGSWRPPIPLRRRAA